MVDRIINWAAALLVVCLLVQYAAIACIQSGHEIGESWQTVWRLAQLGNVALAGMAIAAVAALFLFRHRARNDARRAEHAERPQRIELDDLRQF